ncbi:MULTISPECIES: transposase [Amycolatopsis]|uniref:transposase n=1 Tax=Amycolatopsis TaxID=1813 RepID=UPI001E606EF8|nr:MULTISPECIES: transposase [Amycolatopsis]
MDGTGTTAAHRQKAWPLAKWTERSLINGIRWRIRVGAPWRDIPQVDGPWQTGCGLFRRWRRDGTGKRILPGVQARAEAAGLITWAVSVDSTASRAPQHAAAARPRGSAGRTARRDRRRTC